MTISYPDHLADRYNQSRIDNGEMLPAHIRLLVESWQDSHNMAVDGMFGPLTAAALEKATGAAVDAGPPAQKIGVLALGHAQSLIGKGEEGGNNSGPFVEGLHLKEFDGDDDDDGSWCAAFVSTCFERAFADAGQDMPFRRSTGAKALMRRIGKAGTFVTPPHIQPGDVVAWDRGTPGSWQGHIGIVESYDKATGLLSTIEGNVGRYPSLVRRFTHDVSTGLGRIEGFSRCA